MNKMHKIIDEFIHDDDDDGTQSEATNIALGSWSLQLATGDAGPSEWPARRLSKLLNGRLSASNEPRSDEADKHRCVHVSSWFGASHWAIRQYDTCSISWPSRLFMVAKRERERETDQHDILKKAIEEGHL